MKKLASRIVSRRTVLTSVAFASLAGSIGLPKARAATAAVSAKQVRLGSGGWVTGIQLAKDGTKVIGIDVYGDYGWDDTAKMWVLGETDTRMDASLVNVNSLGCSGRSVAFSDSRRQYKAVGNRLWRSDDAGLTWQVNGPDINMYPNAQGRQNGLRLVVDPHNPDHVLFGSVTNGLLRTTDGRTWSSVAQVPVGEQATWKDDSRGDFTDTLTGYADPKRAGVGVCTIAFDPSSGMIGGRTRRVSVGIMGAGVWTSEDGGATWAEEPNQPYRFSPEQITYTADGSLLVVSARQGWELTVPDSGGSFGLSADGKPVGTFRYEPSGPYDTLQAQMQTAFGDAFRVIYRGDRRFTIQSMRGDGSLTLAAGGEVALSDGTPFLIMGRKSIWRKRSGKWQYITPGDGVQPSADQVSHLQENVLVAADPRNPSRLVAMQSETWQKPFLSSSPKQDWFYVSQDQGDTWNPANLSMQVDGSDVPWLARMFTETENTDRVMRMSVANAVFDPIAPDTVWLAEGVGVWRITLSGQGTSTRATFRAQSAGIEDLVVSDIRVTKDRALLVACWDRPIFRLKDPDQYPSEFLPKWNFGTCYSLSQPPGDPQFIAASIAYQGSDAEHRRGSGYSTDGGLTWTPYAGHPVNTKDPSLEMAAGQICCTTTTNHLWAFPDGHGCFRTPDGGRTWTEVRIVDAGGVSSVGGQFFPKSLVVNCRPLTSDGPDSVFCRLLPVGGPDRTAAAGIYHSVDAGVNWEKTGDLPLGDYWWHAQLHATPGKKGDLWLIGGILTDPTGTQIDRSNPSYHSTDSGGTWRPVPELGSASALGFGPPMPSSTEMTIMAAGYRNGEAHAVMYSTDAGTSWQIAQERPNGLLCTVKTIIGDPATPGRFYLGTNSAGVVQIDLL